MPEPTQNSHENMDDWKHKVPYRVHEKQGDFDTKWVGTCHCGKVKYQLNRDKPLDSKYCHCTTCQRLHGETCSSFWISEQL